MIAQIDIPVHLIFGGGYDNIIKIHGYEMKENTWSPMRDRYGVGDLRLPLSDLLEYTLRDSDNNACDILSA